MEYIETKQREAMILGEIDLQDYILSANFSEYPKLDVSFFQKIYKINNPEKKNSKIFVPQFAITNYYPEQEINLKKQEIGGKRFSLHYMLQASVEKSKWGDRLGEYLLGVYPKAPNIVKSQVFEGLRSEEFLGDNVLIGRKYSTWQEPNKKIRKNFKKINLDEDVVGRSSNVVLSAYFNGIIPDETKEKVKKAKEKFGEDNIYIVWETKPEQWNISSYIIDDPLIMAIEKDKGAFFVDHFDCTPLEDIVKNNFVGGKLN